MTIGYVFKPPQLLVSCLLITISYGSDVGTVTEFLNGKLRRSEVEIVKSYLRKSSDSPMYNPEWKKRLNEETQTLNDRKSLAISQKIFTLAQGDEVISMSIVDNQLQSYPNRTINIYRDSLIRSARSVEFIRSIIWNGYLWLSICYRGHLCSLFISDSNLTLHHRQDFVSEGSPVDANFLIRDSHLFLVIANNVETHPVASVVYLWTGNHMTAMTEIRMASVLLVTMFNDNRGAIVVIFACKEADQGDTRLEVYELFIVSKNGPGSVKKVQSLGTLRVTFLHHYVYYGLDFLLVIDETEAANLFWWHRKEFLPWYQSNEIYGRDILVKNFHIGNDLFIFVARNNSLSLFEMKSDSVNYLDSVKADQNSNITDFQVWSGVAGDIIVVSITERSDNSCGVESWQLFLNPSKEMKNAESKIESCLRKLENRLKTRMGSIERIHAFRKSTSSSNTSRVISESTTGQQTTFSDDLLANKIKNLHEEVDDLLMESRGLIQRKKNGTAHEMVIPSSLIIDGDVQFKFLETPSLHTESINDIVLNDEVLGISFSNGCQHFSESLHGRQVTIHNLKVDSLCGIPKEHWLLKNDTSRSPLKPINQSVDPSSIQIIGDTVRIRADPSFQNIHAVTMNSVNLHNVIDDLFIIGQKQIIRGNLCYQGTLTINNLTVSSLFNNVNVHDLMTLTTNQNFTFPIKIDSLNVHHLTVKKVNGIPVEDAARVSQENVIHGKVVINNLKIKDEFLVKDPSALSDRKRQIHIYHDVEIVGQVKIDRLQVEPQAEIILGDNKKTKGRDIDDLFMNSWTKSSDQIISIPILIFQRGLTIDQLDTEYLNGLREHDYLYTTVDSFPKEFQNIHFASLFVKGSIHHGGNESERVFDVAGDSVTINRRVHVPHLTVQQLYSRRYNGMPVNMIMSNKISRDRSISMVLPNNTKFVNFVVNERLDVDHLVSETLNDHEILENWVMNEQVEVDNEDKTSTVIGSLTNFHSASEEYIRASELDITIDGGLIIEDELTINGTINGQDVNYFLDHLVKSEFHTNNELFIDNLTVHNNLSIEFLHEIQFNEFLSNIFLKSRAQEFPTISKTFRKVMITNLQAERINGFTPEQLHYINDSMIFENDVTFSHLSGDIETDTLNNINLTADVFDRYSFSFESLTRLNSLSVYGSVTWEENSSRSMSESQSLSSFLENAVTRVDEQVITAPIYFGANNSDVYVVGFESTSFLRPNISEIIEDSVIDAPNSTIWIFAKKHFLESVDIGDLEVDKNIAIAHLNSITFTELNNSLIRKFDNETIIEGSCTLTGEGIKISHLVSPNFGPNLPDTSALFVFDDSPSNILPTNIHFEELNVRGNATVNYFDDIKFEKFMKERVTTNGNHEVYSRIQFTAPVEVTNKTHLQHFINNIEVSDLVINETYEEQIIESGPPLFFEDLTIEGDTNVVYINGININQIFGDGIMYNESAVIESDLLIIGDVEVTSELMVSQLMNKVNSSSVLENWDLTVRQYLNGTAESYMAMSKCIKEAYERIYHSDSYQLFSYLEIDENLSFRHFKNTTKIVPMMMNDLIIFDIYGIQSGRKCGELPDDCPCRIQNTVQMMDNNSKIIRKGDDQWVIYNFRRTDGWFEIKVKTNTISSSPRCSLPKARVVSEHTIMSLVILDHKGETFDFDYPIKINGYLNDAKIFVRNDTVYIALAIGYDALHETFRADSLIYQLNLETNELILKLTVSMEAASIVEVFDVDIGDSYIFIGSALDESLLFKLDPTIDEFIFIRSFPVNGGTVRHVGSLHYAHDDFLFIDNAQSNEIYVYYYDRVFENFYFYQSLYTESPITSIETFNVGQSDHYDVFMIASTRSGDLFLYEYMLYEKFQLKMKKQVGELSAVAKFHLSDNQYLLLISSGSSKILRIVKHG